MKGSWDGTRSFRTDLERRILRGLSAEWEAARDMLAPLHRNLVRRPLFSLSDMESRLGYWSLSRNEIVLSRMLVMKHPWDAVREVLHHEMAHQLADAMAGGALSSPHGSLFHEACKLLRANPGTSGTYPTLHQRLAQGVCDENDKVLIRIQKLLALAESVNRHEAEAAMSKAHELIRKYNVDRLRIEAERNFISIFLGIPSLRRFREEYHLAGLLQDFYFVQGIWVSAWVLEKEHMGRVLEVSGTAPNVQLAGYVYDFVRRFIDTQWSRFNRVNRFNRYRKSDFAVGILEGFRQKMESASPSRIRSKALVKVSDPQLDRYVARRYPVLRSFHRGACQTDEKVMEEGMRLGRNLVIAQGLSHRKQGVAGLLPDKDSK